MSDNGGKGVRPPGRVFQQPMDVRGTGGNPRRRQGRLRMVKNGRDHAYGTGLHLNQVRLLWHLYSFNACRSRESARVSYGILFVNMLFW